MVVSNEMSNGPAFSVGIVCFYCCGVVGGICGSTIDGRASKGLERGVEGRAQGLTDSTSNPAVASASSMSEATEARVEMSTSWIAQRKVTVMALLA